MGIVKILYIKKSVICNLRVFSICGIELCLLLFRCLANLLAGLVAYQEEVGTKVVDGVLEDIRLGMEVNLPKFNQRRVAQVKYLGELYNYRMVESADVFKVIIYIQYYKYLMCNIQ